MARRRRGSLAAARQLHQQPRRRDGTRRCHAPRARAPRGTRPLGRRTATRSAFGRSLHRCKRNGTRERVAVVMGGSSAEREISIRSGSEVLRALNSLGYDAQSLDYDERFLDALRAAQAGRRLYRAARPRRRRRPRSGAARVSRDSVHRQRARSLGALDGQAPHQEAARRRRSADAGVGSLRSDRRNAAALAGFARSSAGDQAALRGFVGRRRDRAHARRVDERDARSVEDLLADLGRRVRGGTRVHVRRARRRSAAGRSKSSPIATASTVTTRSTNREAARTSSRRRSTTISPRACRCSRSRRIGCSGCAITRAATSSLRTTSVRTCWRSTALPGLTPVSLLPDACAAVGISFEALIDRLVGYARTRADLRDAVA